MENQNSFKPMPGFSSKNNYKLGLKLLIIVTISLLLLIPQAIIMSMVEERRSTEISANEEVTQKWGNGQELTGPVLFIPADTSTHNAYVLPETLDIEGDIKTRTLKRGIFDFTVYDASVVFSGQFTLPSELKPEQLKHLRTDHAKLLFAISDFKGFADNPTLTYNGQKVELSAEALHLGHDNALSCNVDIQQRVSDFVRAESNQLIISFDCVSLKTFIIQIIAGPRCLPDWFLIRLSGVHLRHRLNADHETLQIFFIYIRDKLHTASLLLVLYYTRHKMHRQDEELIELTQRNAS